MSHKLTIVILLTISIAVHFAYFGRPKETVFDEVHFGKFVSAYYSGEYYFDIHPPLGKLAIAGFANLLDFNPNHYSFKNIGDPFPDKKYLALRFLPALAGTLLPLVIYFLILELGISRIAAFSGALLIIFDNALLTQSRLMLLDPFLLLFGFLSLLFYFKYANNKILNTKYLILTAVFGGLAISIKWTGLSFIALPILIELVEQLKTGIKPTFAKFVPVLRFTSFFIISAAIYFSVFALHFTLLPKPGPGDAFMKPGFREQNLLKNIVNLNLEMYKSNQRLGATHPYGSKWYSWPPMTRPIFYWIKENSRIYFFGNPVVWWASAIAVAISIKYLVLSTKKRNLDKIPVILLGGYALNLLPFIGVKRVMFLYHYLAALIFAILMLVYLIDKTGSTFFDKTQDESLTARKNAKKNFSVLIIASAIVFIFFAPLSYGLPLSNKMYGLMIWFASWR